MKAFFAYPAISVIADLAKAAAKSLELGQRKLELWEENDVAGRPLIEPILSNIDAADFLVADITYLNFNVAFEVGYAISKNKRCLLVKNVGVKGDADQARLAGIFDTLGFETYENAAQLVRKIVEFDPSKPLQFERAVDPKSPVYLVETPIQNEAMTVVSSRLKKTRLRYRSFNPEEQIRLAGLEAAQQVARSFGVLVPLLSKMWKDADIHNIRAAFVTGLAVGQDKIVLLLQEADGPFPIDVIDLCRTFRDTGEIGGYITDFAIGVTGELQSDREIAAPTLTQLANLDLGSPVAENEFETLASYFIATDEYQKVYRGEANIVVGRKGTGKTALFIQLRNAKRKDAGNVIIDLKPEGYQLVELREQILSSLSMGAKEHLIVAFWEYIIYLEIVRKLLEKDAQRHLRDHSIFDLYRELFNKYSKESQSEGGDFSERLLRLSKRIIDWFGDRLVGQQDVRLSSSEITHFLYLTDLPSLKADVVKYLALKEETWLLFDNLDKGWPPTGLTSDDALILRCLVESARKVQNDLRVHKLSFTAVVFIRDDVYELLLRNTADYGKETRVQLEWGDPDLLRELVRARLVAGNNHFKKGADISEIWPQVSVSHVPNGAESLEYFISLSLMRPRNVLKVIDRCKGSAINMRHTKIEVEDIEKGLLSYSNDLLIEADRELTDVLPSAADILYSFIGEEAIVLEQDFDAFLELNGVPKAEVKKTKTHLVYFGIAGIIADGAPKYIWNFNNNMKLMEAAMTKLGAALKFVINPAFYPALGIAGQS